MSNNNKNELWFQAKLLQVELEMNGMLAENKQREINGESLAYTEKQFNELLDYLKALIRFY